MLRGSAEDCATRSIGWQFIVAIARLTALTALRILFPCEAARRRVLFVVVHARRRVGSGKFLIHSAQPEWVLVFSSEKIASR